VGTTRGKGTGGEGSEAPVAGYGCGGPTNAPRRKGGERGNADIRPVGTALRGPTGGGHCGRGDRSQGWEGRAGEGMGRRLGERSHRTRGGSPDGFRFMRGRQSGRTLLIIGRTERYHIYKRDRERTVGMGRIPGTKQTQRKEWRTIRRYVEQKSEGNVGIAESRQSRDD
jgi:hypothetical protein